MIRFSLILFLVTALVVMGCKTEKTPAGPADEILTLDPVPAGKLVLTFRAEFNVDNETIQHALSEQFPDVRFIPVFHCANETQYELRQSLSGGGDEDIVISPNLKTVNDIVPDTLLDLSPYDFSDNYLGNALAGCEINGKLYYLPGPLALFGIIYDKTLFQEHGWQIPHGYDEFLALAKTIRSSGMKPIQPTAKYPRQAQLFLTMFDYKRSFGSVSGFKWIRDFQQGNETMVGKLDNALLRLSDLAKEGIFTPSDFDMQPGNRSMMMYTNNTCAMIVETDQAEMFAKQFNSTHSYGILPIWCGNAPDDDHLMSIPFYYIGLNKKLSEKGNEKKLAKALEVLKFISTPDGQVAINGGRMNHLSSVAGTPYEKTAFNEHIQETIRKGNLVPEVDLLASGNNNAVEKQLRVDMKKYLENSMDALALEKNLDATRDAALLNGIDRGALVGFADDTFTRLETGLFIADVLRAKAGADIGLCLVGTVTRGMVGRIYQGNLYATDINTLSLSVGQGNDTKNDKRLWLVRFTGSQLRELLAKANRTEIQEAIPNTPYYVASGLEITFAPWKEKKLVSVKKDGKELDPQATYTVALWGWPFKDPCKGTILKAFGESSEKILTEAIQEKGIISPPEPAGRFTLVY